MAPFVGMRCPLQLRLASGAAREHERRNDPRPPAGPLVVCGPKKPNKLITTQPWYMNCTHVTAVDGAPAAPLSAVSRRCCLLFELAAADCRLGDAAVNYPLPWRRGGVLAWVYQHSGDDGQSDPFYQS